MAEGDPMANPKKQAHDLIDRLAPSQLSAVVNLLEVMVDPVSRSLAQAPLEDDPTSVEESAALDEARAALERGEGISHEDVLREFGLPRR
jgi:hypothetical protein